MSRAFYKGKDTIFKKPNILSLGINTFGDINGKNPGIHAEHNALLKLQPLRLKKRLMPIDLLVVRLSTSNKLQSSKPCSNCIQVMNRIPRQKGYKLQNIYYSNRDGNIIKTNLSKLENEEQHYSRFYKRTS